ncbi:MAG: type II toxin-antitoxin system VapC family toxin [Chloroflexi bacterium]|nr:type II toxin-antitoxin system VapC family toxin [Chloroflexota bacterium]
MKRRLLDTDTVSLILRSQPSVIERAREHVRSYGKAAISVITCYEVLRGLKHSGATRKLSGFENFMANSVVLDLDMQAARRAADIHADLRRAGTPLEDADLLIAAIAVANDCVLVTNNTAHYHRIADLELENWAS